MVTKPSVYISALEFSSGKIINFSETEKILVVGPNNGGKSQTLKDILRHCQHNEIQEYLAVSKCIISKQGSLSQLKDFLHENAEDTPASFRFMNSEISKNQLSAWERNGILGPLHSLFVKKIGAEERLQICNKQTHVEHGHHKSKPQHLMFDSDEITDKISNLFEQAFGDQLLIDYRAGRDIIIYVGSIPEELKETDRVSDKYVEAVRKNPTLHTQGDGMKSFAGILFEALIGSFDVTLIDEPEAYLHPPQMRKLGKTLAENVETQLFVATHSSNIMRGFLESTKGNLRVLRIRQNNGQNYVTEATPDAMRQLWTKPQLRFSNALEGIFHEQVICCEDDSDCRLFSAVANHLEERSETLWKDTHYIPTGGKNAIPEIAKTLRNIGVPTKAIFDIDLLNDQETLKKTYVSFGGNWNTIKDNWSSLNAAITQGVSSKTPLELKEAINKLFDEDKNKTPSINRITDTLKENKPWGIIKKGGYHNIPSGNAQKYFNRLVAELEKVGIYLVKIGETENFCREIGLHGPKFVTKLLEEKDLGDTCLQDLREFVEHVHNGDHCILEE